MLDNIIFRIEIEIGNLMDIEFDNHTIEMNHWHFLDLYHHWLDQCEWLMDRRRAIQVLIVARYRGAVNFLPTRRQIDWAKRALNVACRMVCAIGHLVDVVFCSFDRSILIRWLDQFAKSFLFPVHLEIVQL